MSASVNHGYNSGSIKKVINICIIHSLNYKNYMVDIFLIFVDTVPILQMELGGEGGIESLCLFS